MAEAERVKAHDEAPSNIVDHAFEPSGAWWSLCKHCNLAQAAHLETTIDSLEEIKKDHIAAYGEVKYATDGMRQRAEELERLRSGGRVRIGYTSDDDLDDE